jgi:hypothetical protein
MNEPMDDLCTSLSLFDYADKHPVWTLLYLIVLMVTVWGFGPLVISRTQAPQ